MLAKGKCQECVRWRILQRGRFGEQTWFIALATQSTVKVSVTVTSLMGVTARSALCGTTSAAYDAGTKYCMLEIRRMIGIRELYLPTRIYCLTESQEAATTTVHGAASSKKTRAS